MITKYNNKYNMRTEITEYGQEYTVLMKVLHEKMYSINDIFEILLPLFTPLINRFLRTFFAKGEDKDDLYQQGLIGLYNAIKSYNFSEGKSFYFHARRCIRLSILNLVRETQAKKRQINIEAVSLDAPIEKYERSKYEKTGNTLYNLLESKEINPEYRYIEDETTSEVFSQINIVLSELELRVLSTYLDGYSYNEISQILCVKEKTVDNALMRIKKKLKLIMSKSGKRINIKAIKQEVI